MWDLICTCYRSLPIFLLYNVRSEIRFVVSLFYTVNPLYNDIRYNGKIRYNVNLVRTKISGSCIFSLLFPCYFSGKHTFCVFVRLASAKRF